MHREYEEARFEPHWLSYEFGPREVPVITDNAKADDNANAADCVAEAPQRWAEVREFDHLGGVTSQIDIFDVGAILGARSVKDTCHEQHVVVYPLEESRAGA